MKQGSTRSLNLATAVAIILYEAERQIGELE
jgi:tRNA(Leu) C34 or U34 (ribose-2'-O)-methylase TrmL